MNCLECAKGGSTTIAVALCQHCNAGLCMDHLRDTATDRSPGQMQVTCCHSTWDAQSWSPRSLAGMNLRSFEVRARRFRGANVLARLRLKHGR